MQYLGSKFKLFKQFKHIVLNDRKEGQYFVDLFHGGGMGATANVDGLRIANDIHKGLHKLYKDVCKGWEPPTNISRRKYHQIKKNPEKFDLSLVTFVSFACSFAGKEWGGYAQNTKAFNYAAIGSRSLIRKAKMLKGVKFYNKNYWKVKIPPKSIIYCDPPYQNTTGYNVDFNHEKFWNWVRQMSTEGHQIFVSEYNAPSDFKCVWERNLETTVNRNKASSRTEKLFLLDN
jgi:DNA adenine methylase